MALIEHANIGGASVERDSNKIAVTDAFRYSRMQKSSRCIDGHEFVLTGFVMLIGLLEGDDVEIRMPFEISPRLMRSYTDQ